MPSISPPADQLPSCGDDRSTSAGKLLQQLARTMQELAAVPPQLLARAILDYFAGAASARIGAAWPERRLRFRRWQVMFDALPRPGPGTAAAGSGGTGPRSVTA